MLRKTYQIVCKTSQEVNIEKNDHTTNIRFFEIVKGLEIAKKMI